ncbi:hypothetical protein B0H13DRAFT_551726 [Mycena leptocephala]|nr:hypothetical protein B0H13DRAFT_551726 [Mycena leptocephala]
MSAARRGWASLCVPGVVRARVYAILHSPPPPPLSYLGCNTAGPGGNSGWYVGRREEEGKKEDRGFWASTWWKVGGRRDAWSASRRRQASSLESPAEPLRVRQRGRRVWILGAVFYGSFRVEDQTRDGHFRWNRAAGRGILGSHETPRSGSASRPSRRPYLGRLHDASMRQILRAKHRVLYPPLIIRVS